MRYLKNFILAVFLALLTASESWGITIEQEVNSAVGTSVSSRTVSITPAGSDRVLLVAVLFNRSTNSPTISSVTFGGTPLTQVGWTNTPIIAVGFYRLIAPTAGAANVVATLSAVADVAVVQAWALSGVDQTTPASGFTIDSGSNSADSFSVTSATGDMVFAAWTTANNFLTFGAGTQDLADGSSGSTVFYARHYTGAASVSISWTGSGSNFWVAAGLNIKASAGGGGSTIRHRVIQ